MKRRTFLKRGLQAGAAGAAALLGSSLLPRLARSAPFGVTPGAAADRMLPAELQAKNVLEIFLYGGLSPWETLYLVEDYGRPTDPLYADTQYWTFVGDGTRSPEAALAACGVPATDPRGVFFANDALGVPVSIGPFARKLRDRADVIDRMRTYVMKHDLEPHEAAIPLALTGKPVGSPALAGLGAHVQRFFAEREPARKSPLSYVLATGAIPGDNIFSAVATGLHPATARPLRIKIDNAERLSTLLTRPGAGSTAERAQRDALLQTYVEQMRGRLRWKGEGEPLRSQAFSDVAQAVGSVANADSVAGVLTPDLFTPTDGNVCGDYENLNIPDMSLRAAAHLLTHPTEPARYVCVVDTGLIQASGGGGYDTHSEHSHDTARNLDNLLECLLRVINEPGENDPSKLDLDDTLVILNTEFGRTPWSQNGSGRNHHPYGYATAFIGGPIRAAQKGIVGAIGPDGVATDHVLCSETRMAALMSLGIYPYAPEAFAVSDVRDVPDETTGVESIAARLLGYAP